MKLGHILDFISHNMELSGYMENIECENVVNVGGVRTCHLD